MSYLRFSTKWAASLARVHQLDEEKQTELTYAIEVLTLNSANVLCTLALGWALGVFRGTVVSLLTVAALRHSAGGGHSESPWRCALVTIIIFPLLALTASYINTWESYYIDILLLGAILAGLACILLYAPVDNPKAPIVSPARRKKLKIIAFLFMSFISMIIPFLLLNNWANGWANGSFLGICVTLSTLWASFNLTPLGHRFWCFIDRIGSNKKGGV